MHKGVKFEEVRRFFTPFVPFCVLSCRSVYQVSPLARQALVTPSAVVDHCAALAHCAPVDHCAVVDHCAAADRSAVADHCAVVDCYAVIQSVPNAAIPSAEEDPSVAVPSATRAVLKAAQSSAIQSSVQISAAKADLDAAPSVAAAGNAAAQTVEVVTSVAFLFQFPRDPVHVSQRPRA